MKRRRDRDSLDNCARAWWGEDRPIEHLRWSNESFSARSGDKMIMGGLSLYHRTIGSDCEWDVCIDALDGVIYSASSNTSLSDALDGLAERAQSRELS